MEMKSFLALLTVAILQIGHGSSWQLGICDCLDPEGIINSSCAYGCVQELGSKKCYDDTYTCAFTALTPWLQRWTNALTLTGYQDFGEGAILNWRLQEDFFNAWGIDVGKIFQYGRCAVDLIPVWSSDQGSKEYQVRMACSWNGSAAPKDYFQLRSPDRPWNLKAFLFDRSFSSLRKERLFELTFDAPDTGPIPTLQQIVCNLATPKENSTGIEHFNSTGRWGSPVIFDLEGATIGQWACTVRGQLIRHGQVINGSRSWSLIVHTNQTTGSKPAVLISHADEWDESADVSYRLEIDGTRGTYAFDMHNWPRDLNQSSYVSYDGAGETVQSQYPFSFDHIGQYRYEIRITSVYYSIAKVDPFSNNDTTLYEWISWHDPQEYHIRPEYDPARHLIFFQTQRWAPLWELRMLDLANTNSSRLMRSDLVSPALALLYSAQNAKDGPSVVFLTKSGLWSLTTLNGTWTEELLVDNKTLDAGDLSAIKNLAVDHSYVYYTNGVDGLHVYSRGDMKTRIIKVALTPADPGQDARTSIASIPYRTIRQVRSLQAFNTESRPFPFEELIGCFYPRLAAYGLRMTSEVTALVIITLQPNMSKECDHLQSRPPYQCRVVLTEVNDSSLSEMPSRIFSVVTRNETVQLAVHDLTPGRRYNCTFQVGPHNWTFFGLPPAMAEMAFEAAYSPPAPPNRPISFWFWILLACLTVIIIVCIVFIAYIKKHQNHKRPETTSGDWHAYKTELEDAGLVPVVRESELAFEGVLSTGRYGDVYKGRRRTSFEEVALTVLHGGHQSEEELKKRFFREALTWARVHKRHAGENAEAGGDRILDLIAICLQNSSDGTVLVAEYMNGGRCDDYLKQHRQHLDQYDALGIAKDIASACVYLSRRGFIHGDIGVRSVYIRLRKDDSRRPLVAKLGNFHATRHAEDPPTPWRTSDRYCAPEGFDGTRSPKTDIWSFGILVWELFMFFEVPENCAPLPYYPPINPQAPSDTVQLYVKDERHRIQCPDQWPNALSRILHSCWQYVPEERPTFGEVAGALDGVHFHQAALSPSESHYGSMRRPGRSVVPKSTGSAEDQVPILHVDTE